jgi:hypothetical protein
MTKLLEAIHIFLYLDFCLIVMWYVEPRSWGR